MPAKGQHRKPRSLNRLTRVCIAAGTGAAALALPLVSVAHASAAEPAKAPAVSAKAQQYTVVRGDTLAKIATAHHVKGGWKSLYNANKKVIGANPSLIRPGQHLTLNTAVVKAAPAPAKKAAPAAAVKKAASPSGYSKPVGDAAIGTPYHAEGSNWSSGYHTGVDFLVWSGTPVHSVAAGTVVHAGADGSYGNDVIIRHADGKYTLYGHLTNPVVSVGQTVTSGQEIGISGATGNVTGPHLHFEVRTTPDYGSDIDPVAYLAAHGVTV
ncbi:LysM peptidoglycan-binding domain-containing M23 family metallopeptidase [Streptomyces cocklensis]|jgi:murein DD-endopeptidase MepM/ murein hydrolase activator NlpD|uniref:LysM domain-containing protein n=1 Tax=Actinacidiphila cocklensis TaxID=887465 RepID=A0A9W4E0J1_9ACTN|nr:peptidoglycan DD-metalloendopeptidase family protein [Actinacidiphila cocklensis]MDD1059049.1 LysM peptidoglycan-binding domain-containing M23 family metallopeptidase [Actinacidiphila cocklensis]CAG6399219.1 LysM domain-containing protein [Actinacidiphila cocklensis]